MFGIFFYMNNILVFDDNVVILLYVDKFFDIDIEGRGS